MRGFFKVKNLCQPAFIYFVLSILGLILTLLHNLGNNNVYTLGHLSTNVPSTTIVFIVELIYVLFWTYMLNLICKDGHTEIAWLLVLFPFFLLFVVMLTATRWEGFKESQSECKSPQTWNSIKGKCV
jgi:hypothetical protein